MARRNVCTANRRASAIYSASPVIALHPTIADMDAKLVASGRPALLAGPLTEVAAVLARACQAAAPASAATTLGFSA